MKGRYVMKEGRCNMKRTESAGLGRRKFLIGMTGAVASAPLAMAEERRRDAARPGEIAYSRTLPVKVETDVFVAGGGAAGMAAAMAAAGAHDVHAVDVKALQGRLAAFGAYLPNARG